MSPARSSTRSTASGSVIASSIRKPSRSSRRDLDALETGSSSTILRDRDARAVADSSGLASDDASKPASLKGSLEHACRTRRVRGSGKSTLFQLLTGTASDPGKVHSGQVGVATLADPRLDFLAALHKPKKVTPATVEFLDTPGLMPGTHGDNPQRLALIREGDALLIVLAGFAGGDPAAELAAFRDEMLFADLSVVTNRAERLEASVKKPRPDREAPGKGARPGQADPGRARGREAVASLGLSDDEKKPLRSFGLLTDKPQVVVLNTVQGQDVPDRSAAAAPDALAIDAKLELELAAARPGGARRVHGRPGKSPSSAATGSSARPTTPSASSPSSPPASPRCGAGTSSGAPPPSRPPARSTPTWPRASSAPRSPPSTSLHEAGTLKEAKARHLQRLEGKDYIVKDGDVVYFRSAL